MTLVLVLVGAMLLAAVVAAAGGFRSRGRGVAVERPVRRRRVVEAPVEEVVERRVVE
jgi:hypothetical protein